MDFGSETGEPIWSRDGRSIFVLKSSKKSHKKELWQLSIDQAKGTLVSQMQWPLPDLVAPLSLSLSPDGRTLAIEDQDSSNTSSIWLLDLAQKTSRRFHQYSSPQPGETSWTADGQEILFSQLQTERMQIMARRIDGKQQRSITACVESCLLPVVSPDGRWVLYSKLGDQKLIKYRRL